MQTLRFRLRGMRCALAQPALVHSSTRHSNGDGFQHSLGSYRGKHRPFYGPEGGIGAQSTQETLDTRTVLEPTVRFSN
ncbi:hypothetical protein PAL_GLEAN10020903 [Pteropus alecto]|uniref:Uncharacterized protein n=1 Tax=Pteropus alecto TaxID=9402 RepID=L5JSP1_PTEAL|nr:hypothetical protein PAL_GLEAN10020903 [Pteropus alecto]